MREILGLEAGQKVEFRARNGQLIVERILPPEEILSTPPKIIVSLDEIKSERLKLSEDAQK